MPRHLRRFWHAAASLGGAFAFALAAHAGTAQQFLSKDGIDIDYGVQAAGTVSYGNYFRLDASLPNRIQLRIDLPGRQEPLDAEFVYQLPAARP